MDVTIIAIMITTLMDVIVMAVISIIFLATLMDVIIFAIFITTLVLALSLVAIAIVTSGVVRGGGGGGGRVDRESCAWLQVPLHFDIQVRRLSHPEFEAMTGNSVGKKGVQKE